MITRIENMKQKLSNILPFGKAWLGLCYCLLTLLLCSGCRTTKTVTTPVIEERIYHDTIRDIQHLRDSVYLHDSIYLAKVGDTVYMERWHTKYKYATVRHDSIVVQRDTIPVTVTVTETKDVPFLLKFLSVIGGTALFLAIAAVVAWVAKK